MSSFVENVNAYLAQNKIKQNFVSMKTGIDPSKLSRILTGVQDATLTDMDKIAAALGKETVFFLDNNFRLVQVEPFVCAEAVFYAGTPGQEQQEFAMKLIKLIENVDEVLSAKVRLLMECEE